MASPGAALCPSLVAYFLYALLDRDRLQSEEFILKERALQLRYRQGANAEIVDATHETIQMEKLPSTFGGSGRR
jgi:hypothetical protein